MMPRMGRRVVVWSILVALLGMVVTSPGLVVWRHPWLLGAVGRMKGQRTIDDRLREFGMQVDARLHPRFAAAGVAYPPHQVALLVFKDLKRMEVHARNEGRPWRRIMELPILAASGGPGPKLREGDRQVPEGIYGIAALNPNSLFHVALRIDYPNHADEEWARADGRTGLGGDIMIHGSSASVGCLAMGDPAAEELFTLAARCGPGQVRVLIAPADPRRHPLVPRSRDPAWVVALYGALTREMVPFPGAAP